jgi:hypothetical protein
MKKIWMIAVGALMMVSCSSDETEIQQSFVADKGEIQLQFVHPSQTRATETNFENTDEVGVYVTAADEALQIGGNEVNNEQFTYNGSSWTSKRRVYWNSGQHNVYAYYPYTKTINDVENYSFELQADQSTAEGFTKSDFLWAREKGVTASATAVSMTFTHKMSCVVVKLQKGENYTGDISDETEVFIHSTVTKASIDLSTGDAGKDNYAGTSSVKALQKSATEYTAIVVPQNITTRRPLVEVITGGVSYLMEGKISLKPGMRHTITVTLDKNPEQTKIDIGGEIVNW